MLTKIKETNMKKTLLNLVLLSTLSLAYASVPQSNNIFDMPKKQSSKIDSGKIEDKYLKEVYSKIPDMQDVGIESNIRSQKEGAALQLIMTNGISKTGFSKDDFARLLNNEASMVKDYVKDNHIKGYAMIENILIFSKGYAQVPKEAMEQYKKSVECQKGYCVFVAVTNIKIFDENMKEIDFDKEKFVNIMKKYDNKDVLWEVKPETIPEEYKIKTVLTIAGFGLGGLDIIDLVKAKKE